MKYPFFISIALLSAFPSCAGEPVGEENKGPRIELLSTPSREGGEPNLFITGDGNALLSWVEYLNDTTDALQFTYLKNKEWAPPQLIAKGSNWFVNWADFPSLAAFDDRGQHLAAHWLAMAGEGTYDYDVQIAISHNSGKGWGAPFVPHQDGVRAEHGFVSLLPVSDTLMFAAWLDGRHTKSEGGHGHGQGGAMTLRGGFFNANGRMASTEELDARVCDCCQTDAAAIPGGMIVAYRDRSDEEVRDISVVRRQNGMWQAPYKVHDDNWKIAGCPVNGPALAVRGAEVAIAWFTAASDTARVQLAFSTDGGASFGAPIRIDEGHPLGRVDVSWIASGEVAVSWMETEGEQAGIRLALARPEGKTSSSYTLAANSASRSSGFPIIEALGENKLLTAWTQADSTGTQVKTAIVTWD